MQLNKNESERQRATKTRAVVDSPADPTVSYWSEAACLGRTSGQDRGSGDVIGLGGKRSPMFTRGSSTGLSSIKLASMQKEIKVAARLRAGCSLHWILLECNRMLGLQHQHAFFRNPQLRNCTSRVWRPFPVKNV
jgi:hypothetical protein